jgi:hypothetical protein
MDRRANAKESVHTDQTNRAEIREFLMKTSFVRSCHSLAFPAAFFAAGGPSRCASRR